MHYVIIMSSLPPISIMFPIIRCMIKGLSALAVYLAQGPSNRAKMQGLAGGGGSSRRRNVDYINSQESGVKSRESVVNSQI